MTLSIFGMMLQVRSILQEVAGSSTGAGSNRQFEASGFCRIFQPGAGYFGKKKDDQAEWQSQKPNNKQLKNKAAGSS